MKYIPTIGLEIHAELKTRTKMFCDSLNDPEEHHPNVNICPVCTGHPGTLPTINKKAVELVVKVGLALGGKIAAVTKFDRKNYFYPDLPKGYQVSQYDEPLVADASMLGIRIRRIHLEEDAGRLSHEKGEDGKEVSLVDYNRAGLPLMELVTEPDIKDGKTAREFAEELQRILRYLGASDADMDKGQMRVEVNISLRKNESDPLGVKVEVKNLNSFRVAEDAINYEIERQTEALDEGKKIIQETRGWDDVKRKTVSQRVKEEAHDYRYFPEPDLPPIDMSASDIDLAKLKDELPELPGAKRERFIKEYGFTKEQATILADDRAAAEYFEEAVSELGTEAGGKSPETIKLLFNYFTSDFWGLLKEDGIKLSQSKISPENFADLIILISSGKLSSRGAKDVLKKMNNTGSDPREIVASEGLEQISGGGELESVVDKVLSENPQAVADFKKGKAPALQFLVGKAMAALKGRGNPGVLQDLFKKRLGV